MSTPGINLPPSQVFANSPMHEDLMSSAARYAGPGATSRFKAPRVWAAAMIVLVAAALIAILAL
jgi:hypothetical protein